MKKRTNWATPGAAVLGGTIAFLLDPQSGRRRRAHAKDKLFHLMRAAACGVEVAARDLSHRSRGLFRELSGRFNEEEVSNDVLAERVRSELGRVCSHPSAIQFLAEDGCVELKGPILKREARHVLSHVQKVRGVEEIDDDLIRHAQPGDV